MFEQLENSLVFGLLPPLILKSVTSKKELHALHYNASDIQNINFLVSLCQSVNYFKEQVDFLPILADSEHAFAEILFH